DGLCARSRTEHDAAGRRPQHALDDVVDRVECGNLVGDNFQNEQRTEDPECDITADPRPPSGEIHRGNESVGESEQEQWHPGIEASGCRKAGADHELDHGPTIRPAPDVGCAAYAGIMQTTRSVRPFEVVSEY